FIIPCSSILPVAVNDFATGSKDTFLHLDILANDQDTDGKGLTISGIVLLPKHGVLSISGSTSVVYTPVSDFCGKDIFTYQAQGFSGGVTNTATGYITIRCSLTTGGNQGEISYSSAPNYPTIPVENTITDFICPTIVKVFDENELRATDIPNNEFADDIKAILMYRGLERDEKNLGLSTLRYRNDGIAINDSEFESNRGTTRAEFVKVLVRALACHYRFIGTDAGFSDVPNDRWYAEYITYAVKNKWINGYVDGTFRPDAMITRGEAAKILANAIHLSGQTRKEDVPFIDIHSQSEFAPYIVALAENDIISIPTDGFYRPDDFISRPEFSKIVRRTFLNIEVQK
ncbi:S-layer homology domain-containing protein, partial [Candidatus Gracilibacteria bacterium]|nr:S-layer homology domain-containing protein [Candidatus Gracilibacteria bacterium]